MTHASPPLADLRVWITRPAQAGDATAERWRAAGALPLLAPTVELRPLRLSPADRTRLVEVVPRCTIVLTSANAARFLMAALGDDPALAAQLRARPAACVGAATAAVARACGYQVTEVANTATGAALADALCARDSAGGPRRTFLIPGGDRQRPELPDRLRAEGASIVEATVYRTLVVRTLPAAVVVALRARELDAVALYSPSAVEGLMAGAVASGLNVDQLPPALVLGPTTASAARAAGLSIAVAAEEPGEEALLEATTPWWRARR